MGNHYPIYPSKAKSTVKRKGLETEMGLELSVGWLTGEKPGYKDPNIPKTRHILLFTVVSEKGSGLVLTMTLECDGKELERGETRRWEGSYWRNLHKRRTV